MTIPVCETCGGEYVKEAVTFCSSTFHCCHDCEWTDGAMIKACRYHYDKAIKVAVEWDRRVRTDNHTRDAERMQGIRERAERYANGGHRFEPRDVIYVLCELDAERDRAARELAASKHCEKHPEPYTCCGVAQSYELMLDAERQRADAAERELEVEKKHTAALERNEAVWSNGAKERDRRIAELETTLRRAKDALVTEGVCGDGDSIPWIDAALTTSASPEPVSKSVAKRHAIMREAREDATNLADPGNNLVDESPTTSAKLNGTVEDCDPRQVDRNVSLDTHSKEPK